MIDTRDDHALREFLVDHYTQRAPHTPPDRLDTIINKDLVSRHWQQSPAWKIADYKPYQCLDGEGVRHSVYVSYCPFVCQGCFNKSAQKVSYGVPGTHEFVNQLCRDLDNPHVAGVTVAGGEPFLSAIHLLPLVTRIRHEFPDKTIWSYSGFLYEILADSRDEKKNLLDSIDVLIDGQFIEEEKDIRHVTPFRGSTNQRLVDVHKSVECGHVVEYDL